MDAEIDHEKLLRFYMAMVYAETGSTFVEAIEDDALMPWDREHLIFMSESTKRVARGIDEVAGRLNRSEPQPPASGDRSPKGEDANAASCLHESPAPKGRR